MPGCHLGNQGGGVQTIARAAAVDIYSSVCVVPSSYNLRPLVLSRVEVPKLTSHSPLVFSIAVCDAVKNYREGQDLLD